MGLIKLGFIGDQPILLEEEGLSELVRNVLGGCTGAVIVPGAFAIPEEAAKYPRGAFDAQSFWNGPMGSQPPCGGPGLAQKLREQAADGVIDPKGDLDSLSDEKFIEWCRTHRPEPERLLELTLQRLDLLYRRHTALKEQHAETSRLLGVANEDIANARDERDRMQNEKATALRQREWAFNDLKNERAKVQAGDDAHAETIHKLDEATKARDRMVADLQTAKDELADLRENVIPRIPRAIEALQIAECDILHAAEHNFNGIPTEHQADAAHKMCVIRHILKGTDPNAPAGATKGGHP